MNECVETKLMKEVSTMATTTPQLQYDAAQDYKRTMRSTVSPRRISVLRYEQQSAASRCNNNNNKMRQQQQQRRRKAQRVENLRKCEANLQLRDTVHATTLAMNEVQWLERYILVRRQLASEDTKIRTTFARGKLH
jgi:hypothetical protein